MKPESPSVIPDEVSVRRAIDYHREQLRLHRRQLKLSQAHRDLADGKKPEEGQEKETAA